MLAFYASHRLLSGSQPIKLMLHAAKHALSQLSYALAPVNSDLLANRSSRQLAPPAFAEATAGNLHSLRERRLVGLGRLDLPTTSLSSARSNQLSYKPSPGFYLDLARP